MRLILCILLVAIAITATESKSLSRATQRLRAQDQSSVSVRDPFTLTVGILSLSAKAAGKVADYVTAKKLKAADADNRKKVQEQKELLCSMLISQAETVTHMQSQAVDAVAAVRDKANPADVKALAKECLKTRAYIDMRVAKLCGARAVAALKKHQEDTYERLKKMYKNAKELDDFYEEAKSTISGDAPAEAPAIGSIGAMVAEGLGLGAVEAAVSSVKSVVDVGRNFWGLGETINGYMIEIDRMNKVQTDTVNDMQYFVCATQLKLVLAHSRFPMSPALYNTLSTQAKTPDQKKKLTELTTAWKQGFLALAKAFSDSGCPDLTGVLMNLVLDKKADILRAEVTKDLWDFVVETRAIRPASSASNVIVDIKAVAANAAAPAGFEFPSLLQDDGTLVALPADVKKALENIAVTKTAQPRQVKQLGFAVTDVSVYLDRKDQCSSIAKTFLGYNDIRPGKAMKRSPEVDRVRADLQAKGYDLAKDALILGNIQEDDKCVTVFLLFKKAALGMPVTRISVVENVMTQRAGTLSDKQKNYAQGKVFIPHTHLNLRTCELEKANALEKMGAVCKAQYYLAVEKDPRLYWDKNRKMIVSPGDPSA